MKKHRKILIIIQRSNGDVFLSIGLIKSIFKFYNSPQIDLLVNNDTFQMANLLPHVSKIITFSYKNKTGMPPTPTDFDAIAEGFTLGALPEDFSTSKPTGTFYIPGEMVIVEMEEGVQKSIKSYKS